MYDNAKGRVVPQSLRLSEPGLNFIKRFEQLRLKAYQDQGGVWTIGYGHTATAKMGMTITEEQALQLLRHDTLEAMRAVNIAVPVPLYQYEYDALVSFIFNVGAAQFGSSTMRRALKMRRYDLAADEFERWNKVKGKVSNGLKRRRHEEELMFRQGTYKA